MTAKYKYLSERQRNVVKLMAQNYSNKKIAKALYTSESTIKSEVSTIMRKLHANGRVQATLLAYKKRWVDI